MGLAVDPTSHYKCKRDGGISYKAIWVREAWLKTIPEPQFSPSMKQEWQQQCSSLGRVKWYLRENAEVALVRAAAMTFFWPCDIKPVASLL